MSKLIKSRLLLICWLMLLAGAWLGLLSGCKISDRTSDVKISQVNKLDSLRVIKKDSTYGGIKASSIEGSGFRFILDKNRKPIKPGEPILEYAADNASEIKSFYYKKKDTTSAHGVVSYFNQLHTSRSDSAGKTKITNHSSNNTLGANVPWFVWVILALLAGLGLFLKLRRQ